jgi:putative membrane protein
MEYPGLNGFLGTRASLMLDLVFLAMFAVLPVLGLSIWLVRSRRAYALHKRLQLTLAAVLLVTVAAFELDMRVNGWRERARASAYYGSEGQWGLVDWSLAIHLVFAISTALAWVVVVAGALRKFSNPPQPGPHSRWHRRLGWVAAIDMGLTALTGWIFYLLAFVG